ncbi:3beta-hydroxysteroid-dehydrogenase/decarboxylase-like, partial [Olea europaea var. sylvestris]|uniref:3beta-hydroxysteroid- dehydrogenase/decarboxylase-like n=1 Tax=Olea europaea var. sylvestris TaxID=158386 RepID=UPI000C1D3881
ITIRNLSTNIVIFCAAIEGVPVVFFTDSSGSLPCDFCFCYNIIVQGAKNVVNACRECKVKRLIYNSSADVVIDITRDILNGDESLPYPDQFQDIVASLKAQAEALILSANDIDGLLTCALRPCNVFGPGDEKLIPFLVNVANSGWAKFIIGNGAKQSDFTYVDNVSHALICAEESLDSHMVSVSGKAFFVNNLEPMKFWEFVSLVLDGLGYQRYFTFMVCLIFIVFAESSILALVSVINHAYKRFRLQFWGIIDE